MPVPQKTFFLVERASCLLQNLIKMNFAILSNLPCPVFNLPCPAFDLPCPVFNLIENYPIAFS